MFYTHLESEILKQAKKLLSKKFLDEVCKDMKLNKSDKHEFYNLLIESTARYLQLKNTALTEQEIKTQNAKLAKYKKKVHDSKTAFDNVLSDPYTEWRFHKALRNKYEVLPDNMKEMLRPYMDERGYDKNIFSQFLELISETAKEAESLHLGYEAPIQYFRWWVAEIASKWPRSSAIKLILGYYSEGEYNAQALDILFNLIRRIAPGITEENLETAVRYVKRQGENIVPANFLSKKAG